MGIHFQNFDYKKDIVKQRSLFTECFPETNGTSIETIDHYFWKFHSGPFTPNSFEYIAIDDESNIIGYYAAIPYPYSINGKPTQVGMVCDVMTGKMARGKGVFTKLGLYSTEMLKTAGIPFTDGFPIRAEVIPGHLKAGWKIVFNLPLYLKVLKVDNLSVFKKVKVLAPFINYPLKWLGYMTSFFSREHSTTIYNQHELNKIEGYDEFFSKWTEGKTTYLEKSIPFLKWRLGAPTKSYQILTIRFENIIVGLAITTMTIKEGVTSLAILDIMIPDSYLNYSKTLHTEIEKLAKRNKAEVVLVMASKFYARKYRFSSNLYLKSPFTFKLIHKYLSDDFSQEILNNSKNWHLMWIDSDDL